MAEFVPLDYAEHPTQVLELLALPHLASAELKVGTARLTKGETVPPDGMSQHPQHEVSIFLRGSATLETGGETREVGPGEVVWIPAGEAHRAQAHEECEIFWVLFGGDHG